MSLSEECKKYVSKIKKLAKEPKPKKMNGYNLFLKEKSTGLEGTAHQRMQKVSTMWKKLSDEKKEIWKVKAEKINKKAVKEFEEEGEELDEQVKELKVLIDEIIANFKKNLKSKKCKGKKCKGKNFEISENKVSTETSALKKLIDTIGEFEDENGYDYEEKRLKALQEAVVEWCVNYT